MTTTQRVTTDLDLRVLANRILDHDRTRTILIATTPTPTALPTIDVRMLVEQLSDDHEVWVVTADRTRLLEEIVGVDAGVYGGAVRIYPAGEAPDAGYVWLPKSDATPQDMAREVLDALAPAPASAVVAGDGEARTAADGARVADQLLHPDRDRPLMLISVPASHNRPWADVDEIRSTIQGWCDLVIIHTGPATRALADRLPRGCEAFGGAARVYPTGTAWLNDWDIAPLRLCYDAEGAAWLTRNLIHDAWRQAPTAAVSSSHHTPQQQAAGTVLGIVGGRGLVRLDHGATVTIWPEALDATVEVGQLLAAGMRVVGIQHEESGRLDISGMRTLPDAALTDYVAGAQVLVRAGTVTDPDQLPVELLPGTTGTIARHLVTTSSWPLADLVSPGEVLVARILTTQPWTLSLDTDDDAPLTPAPALLTGGPAWLTPPIPDREPAAAADVDEQPSTNAESDQPLTTEHHAPTGPTPADAGHTALAAATPPPDWEEERSQLAAQLRREKNKTSAAREQVKVAKTRLRAVVQERDQARAALAALQADTGRAAADGDLFTDPVEQLRFEIGLAWARRIPASQKADLPLRTHTIGPGFLPSLDELHGLDRSKVVAVIVEVLTGLAAQLDGRELHQLRSSDAGNAPAIVRDDGAVAWRCALQRGTPSARRLHFWQLGDGSIELSAVRLHDDMRP